VHCGRELAGAPLAASHLARAKPAPLPSYTAKTGATATVFHARSVGLEHNVPKIALLQFD
jgi:hypothetical protein